MDQSGRAQQARSIGQPRLGSAQARPNLTPAMGATRVMNEVSLMRGDANQKRARLRVLAGNLDRPTFVALARQTSWLIADSDDAVDHSHLELMPKGSRHSVFMGEERSSCTMVELLEELLRLDKDILVSKVEPSGQDGLHLVTFHDGQIEPVYPVFPAEVSPYEVPAGVWSSGEGELTNTDHWVFLTGNDRDPKQANLASIIEKAAAQRFLTGSLRLGHGYSEVDPWEVFDGGSVRAIRELLGAEVQIVGKGEPKTFDMMTQMLAFALEGMQDPKTIVLAKTPNTTVLTTAELAEKMLDPNDTLLNRDEAHIMLVTIPELATI